MGCFQKVAEDTVSRLPRGEGGRLQAWRFVREGHLSTLFCPMGLFSYRFDANFLKTKTSPLSRLDNSILRLNSGISRPSRARNRLNSGRDGQPGQPATRSVDGGLRTSRPGKREPAS